MNNDGILPVIIAYKTYPWIKVALGSFHEFFPNDTILVIDNNPNEGSKEWSDICRIEATWVKSYQNCLYRVSAIPQKRHGLAMDQAAKITREQGFTHMLHIEPDCLITGTCWFNNLTEGIRNNWMVGFHLKNYGPIHPTPSMWEVKEIKTSFEVQSRSEDEKHPRFHELFDLEHLHRRVLKAGEDWDWWRKNWDTAQRAWFLAAIEDKAKLVAKTDDFMHFFGGSRYNRNPKVFEDSRLEKYLR